MTERLLWDWKASGLLNRKNSAVAKRRVLHSMTKYPAVQQRPVKGRASQIVTANLCAAIFTGKLILIFFSLGIEFGRFNRLELTESTWR